MNSKLFYLICAFLLFENYISCMEENGQDLESKKRKTENELQFEKIDTDEQSNSDNFCSLSELAMSKVIKLLITPDLAKNNFSINLLKKIKERNDTFTDAIYKNILPIFKTLFFDIWKPCCLKEFKIDSKIFSESSGVFSPNGSRLAVWTPEGQIGLYDNQSLNLIYPLKIEGSYLNIRWLAFIKNCTYLLIVDKQQLWALNLKTKKLFSLYKLDSEQDKIIGYASLSHDNRLLLISIGESNVDNGGLANIQLWNMDNFKLIKSIHDCAFNSYPGPIAFHKSEYLALVGCGCTHLVFFDLRDLNDIKTIEYNIKDHQEKEIICSIEFIPKSKMALIATHIGEIYLCDLELKSFQKIDQAFQAFHDNKLKVVSIGLDGTYACTLFHEENSSNDSEVIDYFILWDLSNCNEKKVKKLRKVPLNEGIVDYKTGLNISFNPDGKRALIGTDQGTEMWDFEIPDFTLEQMVLILKFKEMQKNNLQPFDLLYEDYYKQIFQTFNESQKNKLRIYFKFPIYLEEFLVN